MAIIQVKISEDIGLKIWTKSNITLKSQHPWFIRRLIKAFKNPFVIVLIITLLLYR